MTGSQSRAALLKSGDVLHETYQVVDIAQEAAAGVACRAVNTHMNAPVLLHALRPEHGDDETAVDRLRRAARAVAHPAVARSYGLQYTRDYGGLYFAVVERVDGPSLAEAVRARGPMPEDVLKILAMKTLEGLAALHAHGMTCEALSADTLILRGGRAARPVLLPCAGVLEAALEPEARRDPRDDLFALGAALCVAASGRAFESGWAQDQMRASQARPEDIAAAPESLRSFLSALTQRNPRRRPQSAVDAAEMLRAASARSPAPPPTPRWRAYAAWGTAAAVVAGVALTQQLKTTMTAHSSVEMAAEQNGAPDAAYAHADVMAESDAGAEELRPVPASAWSLVWREIDVAAPDSAVKIDPKAPQNNGAPVLKLTALKPGPAPGASQELLQSVSETRDADPEEGADADADQTQPASASVRESEDGPHSEDGLQPESADAADAPQTEAAEPEVTETETAEPESTETETAEPEVDQSNPESAAPAGPPPAPTGSGWGDVTIFIDEYDVNVQLQRHKNCGPLTAQPPRNPRAGYNANHPLRLQGAVARESDVDSLIAGLSRLPGEPEVNFDDLLVLNPSVCLIRALTPPPTDSGVEIVFRSANLDPDRYGQEITSDEILRDEVLVIEITTPADMTGYLTALLTSDNGSSLLLLPHQLRRENKLQNIGAVQDGRRRVFLSYPASQANGRDKFALELDGVSFGAGLVTAVVSGEPLIAPKEMHANNNHYENWLQDGYEELRYNDVEMHVAQRLTLDAGK